MHGNMNIKLTRELFDNGVNPEQFGESTKNRGFLCDGNSGV